MPPLIPLYCRPTPPPPHIKNLFQKAAEKGTYFFFPLLKWKQEMATANFTHAGIKQLQLCTCHVLQGRTIYELSWVPSPYFVTVA